MPTRRVGQGGADDKTPSGAGCLQSDNSQPQMERVGPVLLNVQPCHVTIHSTPLEVQEARVAVDVWVEA
jgi:hypothetical protein